MTHDFTQKWNLICWHFLCISDNSDSSQLQRCSKVNYAHQSTSQVSLKQLFIQYRPSLCGRVSRNQLTAVTGGCWQLWSIHEADAGGAWLRLHWPTTIQAIEEQTAPPWAVCCGRHHQQTCTKNLSIVSLQWRRPLAQLTWSEYWWRPKKLTIWICVNTKTWAVSAAAFVSDWDIDLKIDFKVSSCKIKRKAKVFWN